MKSIISSAFSRQPVPGLLLLLTLLAGCGLFAPVDTVDTTRRRSPAPARPGGSPTSYIRADIVEHAGELLGVPYKYGGNSPREGFDCSGLVRFVYSGAGLPIERVSREQAKQGKLVRPNDARPGDLVFFKRGTGPVFHVSVIERVAPGEVWVVHATSSRGVIRENIMASTYWKPKIYQIRDVIN